MNISGALGTDVFWFGTLSTWMARAGEGKKAMLLGCSVSVSALRSKIVAKVFRSSKLRAFLVF